MAEMEPISPPSYTEKQNLDPKPLAAPPVPRSVILCHCAPGGINKRGFVVTGEQIEALDDAIMLPAAATYTETLSLLAERAEKRFHMSITGPGSMAKGAVVLFLEKPKRNIWIDEGNWTATRAFLGKKEAKLIFYFAEVPLGYNGLETKREHWLRRLLKGVFCCYVQADK